MGKNEGGRIDLRLAIHRIPRLKPPFRDFGWAARSTLHLHDRCLSFRKPALSQCSYWRAFLRRSSPSRAAFTNHHNMAED
jgi:hypothetical protein